MSQEGVESAVKPHVHIRGSVRLAEVLALCLVDLGLNCVRGCLRALPIRKASHTEFCDS